MSYLQSLFHRKTITKQKWLHGFVALFLIIGVSLIVFWFYKTIDYKTLVKLGYFGFIAVCFFGSSVIFLPFPVSAFVAISAVFLNPLFVGLVGGLAVTLASMISYIVGAEGKIIFEDIPGYNKFHSWTVKNTHGFWSIFLISLLPIPIFNILSATAGILGVKWYQYFISALLGKIISYLIIAFMFHFLGSKFIEFLPLIKNYFI